MKTSNILGILAGAAIGDCCNYIKSGKELLELSNAENSFDKIAQQFSDKLSSGFKTAESKINQLLKSNEFSKQ
jgi:hypothetical protein